MEISKLGLSGRNFELHSYSGSRAIIDRELGVEVRFMAGAFDRGKVYLSGDIALAYLVFPRVVQAMRRWLQAHHPKLV